MIKRLLFSAALLLSPIVAQAQTRAVGNGFEVQATQEITYDSATLTYEAVGDVQFVAGETVLLSDSLRATLLADQSGIGNVRATGQVFLKDSNLTLRTQSLRFDPTARTLVLDQGPTVLEFGNIRLATDAPASLDLQNGGAAVDGAFTLVDRALQVSGSKLDLVLEGNAMQSARIGGPVVIQQGDVLARSENLTFDAAAQVLRLSGGVAVQQPGGVVLTGDTATLDLRTNAVTLNSGNNGRVSGTLGGS